MKFQLLMENDTKKIVLVPENQNEALFLGTIVDPNRIAHDSGDDTTTARVTAEVSSDRAPYRKVVKLNITF